MSEWVEFNAAPDTTISEAEGGGGRSRHVVTCSMQYSPTIEQDVRDILLLFSRFKQWYAEERFLIVLLTCVYVKLQYKVNPQAGLEDVHRQRDGTGNLHFTLM